MFGFAFGIEFCPQGIFPRMVTCSIYYTLFPFPALPWEVVIHDFTEGARVKNNRILARASQYLKLSLSRRRSFDCDASQLVSHARTWASRRHRRRQSSHGGFS